MNLKFYWSLLLLSVLLAGQARAAQEIVDAIDRPWTGDFDDILEHRHLRALVVYNKLMYFLDGATQRGASYEALQQFEKFINEKHNLKTRELEVVYIPVLGTRCFSTCWRDAAISSPPT